MHDNQISYGATYDDMEINVLNERMNLPHNLALITMNSKCIQLILRSVNADIAHVIIKHLKDTTIYVAVNAHATCIARSKIRLYIQHLKDMIIHIIHGEINYSKGLSVVLL